MTAMEKFIFCCARSSSCSIEDFRGDRKAADARFDALGSEEDTISVVYYDEAGTPLNYYSILGK